jgi:hypothetical protein
MLPSFWIFRSCVFLSACALRAVSDCTLPEHANVNAAELFGVRIATQAGENRRAEARSESLSASLFVAFSWKGFAQGAEGKQTDESTYQ